MPVVAVLLMAQVHVHLYFSCTRELESWNEKLGIFQTCFCCSFSLHVGSPKAHPGEIVIVFRSTGLVSDPDVPDGIIDEYTLYIVNSNAIKPSDILLVRKRLATPVTSPMAISRILQLSGNNSEYPPPPSLASIASLNRHLQELSGAEMDDSHPPVLFTAGLPSMSSFYITLAKRGGGDVIMCSTAYGGSSQLLDILSSRSNGLLRKQTFHLQGDTEINEGISTAMNLMLEKSTKLLPTTALFVEIPTNPDMKVPNLEKLVQSCDNFRKMVQRHFILVVDTTFSPHSQILKKIEKLSHDLPVIVYISLSKSVSGGLTTSGVLVANHTEFAISFLEDIRVTANHLDTTARDDQLCVLVDNHEGVENRLASSYSIAKKAASFFTEVVQEITQRFMPVKFVTEEQASEGFLSTTFSFNLPSPQGATIQTKEALAQQFVDLLCAHTEYFKPCVSFGQNNTLIYATVPATSTQGAIKAEDKDKQAVDGIQLIRLSFPPRWDEATVFRIIRQSLEVIYK
eukprot:TRINITY_DN9428_c0_g1_i12.p1 TRINITY_DN9428_c0_g1~~TRINITY_DN9428_c0_g1_i12.p1  ORF type:complete len:513 (-),score=91.30 TRINITY_DN9428_c0_g1_i12:87-1625(-)